MNITAIHYRFLYALVLLGIIAYSIAEEDLVHLAIAAPIVVAAWVLVGPFSPPAPRWLVNGALIAVTAHMLFSWAGDIGDTIGVLCRYVTWLQLIKLFEPRAPRDQAQIIMLSIMLAIGACLTSVTIGLGAVLVLFVPVLIVSVMLFQMHSALARSGAQIQSRAPRGATLQFGALSASTTCALVLIAFVVFVVMPRGAGEGLLGRWKPPESDPVTGFRDHVQLGTEGLLSESRRIVMEMTVDPPATDQGARGRAHLLRGAVLDTYDPRRALWLRDPRSDEGDVSYKIAGRRGADSASPFRDGFVLRREDSRAPTARLDPDAGPYTVFRITILDDRPERLFTKWCPVAVDLRLGEQPVGSLRRGRSDFELTVRSSAPRFTYAVVCSPNTARIPDPGPKPSLPDPGGGWIVGPIPDPSDTTPVPMSPFVDPPGVGADPGSPTLGPAGAPQPRRTSFDNPFGSGRVHDLAARILAEARVDLAETERDTRARAASALQMYLQKNYAYTTQMIAPADGQDPIEMFLFDPERGGRGHCEYFAAAMTALCRSIGIPARLIAGYVASEFDAASGVYTIRDNHAHAWTEVEVRPGHWVEFDPSPAAEIARLHQPPGGWTAVYRRIMSAVQIAWAERFIGYDRSSQSSALQSLGASPSSLLSSMNEWVQEQINGRKPQMVNRRAAAAEAAQAFAFVLLLATVSTMVLLASVALVRRCLRWRRRRGITAAIAAPADPASRTLARMHAAMLASLARGGRPKPPGLPPLVHARSLADADGVLAAAAESLTSRFYASRYGRRPPTAQELETARAQLRIVRRRAARMYARRESVPS